MTFPPNWKSSVTVKWVYADGTLISLVISGPKNSWRVFCIPRTDIYQFQHTDWSTIPSFHKYLGSTYSVPNTYPGPADAAVSKTSSTPCLHGPSKCKCTICDTWARHPWQNRPRLLESGQGTPFPQPKQLHTHLVRNSDWAPTACQSLAKPQGTTEDTDGLSRMLPTEKSLLFRFTFCII